MAERTFRTMSAQDAMVSAWWRARAERRTANRGRWCGALDPAAVTAAALLDAAGYSVDLGRVVVGVLDDCEGIANRRRQRIWLACDGRAYRAALDGDARPLAGVLAHEFAHLAGEGEREAFAVELRALRELGAAPTWVAFIERLQAQHVG